MCKNCENCNNLDLSNPFFTRCKSKKVNDNVFDMNVTNTTKDDEVDFECPGWRSNEL